MSVSKKIRVKKLLAKIRVARPSATLRAFKKIANLRRIGQGAFRTVYQLDTLPLVVKLPRGGSGAEHNLLEVKRIKRLQGGLLDKHLPKIELFDKKTGVLIMRYYEDRPTYHVADLLSKFMSRLTGVSFTDIKESNMRVEDGVIKFVDLAF